MCGSSQGKPPSTSPAGGALAGPLCRQELVLSDPPFGRKRLFGQEYLAVCGGVSIARRVDGWPASCLRYLGQLQQF